MSLTYNPFAQMPELDALGNDLSVNVSYPERLASVFLGGAMVGLGVRQRSVGGLLLALVGGALVHRGALGRCLVYETLGIDTHHLHRMSGVPDNRGSKVVRTVTIARPKAEVYRFWRRLENLPRFMPHLESVEELDAKRSHWRVKAAAGGTVEWTAEIINEREGELLAWQSLPGSQVRNAGSVWFEDVPEGTRVKVALEFDPPGGAVGTVIATLAGESPDAQLAQDLERFKQLLEDSDSDFDEPF